MAAILADVDRLIVPSLTTLEPSIFLRLFRYFDFRAAGIFGELLAAAFDNKADVFGAPRPASTELEEVTLDWLRQMMGPDAGLTGITLRYRPRSRACIAIAAAREGAELRIREQG